MLNISVSFIVYTSVHLCAAVRAVRLFLIFNYTANPVMFSAMRAVAFTTLIRTLKSDYPMPMHHRRNVSGGDKIPVIEHSPDKCLVFLREIPSTQFKLNFAQACVFSHCQPSCSMLQLLHPLAKSPIFQPRNRYM